MSWLASLGWQPVLIGALTVMIFGCVGICRASNRKTRRTTNARLGHTPFFRSITDNYYRANRL